MRKLILIAVLLGFTFILQSSKLHAFCLVSSESGSPTNIYSLPYAVSEYYSGEGGGASCNTGSTDAYDDYYGLDQAMLFATLEWGYQNDVNEITLSSPLTFNNTNVNLVIGNYPEEFPEQSDYDYLYADFAESGIYVPVVDDYGIVTIHAKNNFDPDENPFICQSDTSEVILRNLIIQTNGLSEEEMFAGASCLRDGGAVYVCGGDITGDPQANPNNWCDDDEEGGNTEEGVDADGDGFNSEATGGTDCDDGDDEVYEGAPEKCNDKDDDCDGNIDDGVGTTTFFPDLDADGYGDEDAAGITDCEAPAETGYAENKEDCDDTASDADGDGVADGFPINPLATEMCGDGVDNNCDDVTDPEESCDDPEDDADGDTFTETTGDCDDTATDADGDGVADGFAINPDADEICDDEGEIDEDCNGTANENDSICPNSDSVDDDGDGFSEDGTVGGAEDCDDSPTGVGINPDAVEAANGFDDDCDGLIDENVAGGADTDEDGDGFCEDASACADPADKPGDCDDNDDQTNPISLDVCDGEDNNCDGTPDEGCTGDPDVDDDLDGFSENEMDCNDADATINPGVEGDFCGNLVDDDCNGKGDDFEADCIDTPEEESIARGCGLMTSPSATNLASIFLMAFIFFPLFVQRRLKELRQ